MSESTTTKEVPAATSADCPICYETFQSPKVLRRKLSCGHTFCHDCLVKCLVASQDKLRFPNCLVCPVCRFVTLICRKRSCWPSKTVPTDSSLELPLSPSLLPHGMPPATSNTLVIPDHFLTPFHEPSIYQNACGCPSVNSVVRPSGLERQSHIFVISRYGMPMIEQSYDVITQDRDVEAPGSVVSRRSLLIGFLRSPIVLAVLLISLVTVLGAVFPMLMQSN